MMYVTQKKGFSLLEVLAATTILSISGVVGAKLLLQATKEYVEAQTSTAALPFEEALSQGVLNNVSVWFNANVKKVPPLLTWCPERKCYSTFGGLLPAEYVNLNTSPVVGKVSSLALAYAAPTFRTVVDPMYCRNYAQGELSSTEFILATRNSSGFCSYSSKYYTLDTTGGLLGSAQSLTKIDCLSPLQVKAGDVWFSANGQPNTFPQILGFYWENDATAPPCVTNSYSDSTCVNTWGTIGLFPFYSLIGDLATSKVPRSWNIPSSVKLDSNTSAALRRCGVRGISQQTLDQDPAFGNADSLYFCLKFGARTSTLPNPQISNNLEFAFGEFTFVVRDIYSNKSLSCVELGARKFETQPVAGHIYELHYTLYWGGRPGHEKTITPKFRSGFISRMAL